MAGGGCILWVTTYRICWWKQVKNKICLFLLEVISCTHVLVLGIQNLQPKVEMNLQNTFAVLLVKLFGNMPTSTVLSDNHYYFFKSALYNYTCTTKFLNIYHNYVKLFGS